VGNDDHTVMVAIEFSQPLVRLRYRLSPRTVKLLCQF
jgi:hypothetical protein